MMTPTKRALALLKLYGGTGGYQRVATATGLHPGYVGRLANERGMTKFSLTFPSKQAQQRIRDRVREESMNDFALWA